MKVRSIAEHLPDGEVLLIAWQGRDIRVEKGKPVDVPDELAAKLLEQSDAWVPVKAEKAAAS